MKKDPKEKAQEWLNSNLDEADKLAVAQMLENDDDELTEAFYKDLEFGTGGLRGIMGIGSNRVNKYTIGMATQGLADYLLESFPNQDIKVAIACDSRNNSAAFAKVVAGVFSANGIKAYSFESLRPTPELSFTIRHLGCQGGVVLTASHNPKEYNGYKAYWEDGGQLIAPHDKNVIEKVKAIESIDAVKFTPNDSLIELIGDHIDKTYVSKIVSLSLSPDAVAAHKDLKIVYSPLHGTGYKLVPQCLKDMGFENVHVLEEQATPDGNFPTVVYPNPEEAEALSMSLQKARELDADLIMATDPDADRVGIAVKDHRSEFVLLNGNQTGSLLVYYVLQRWSETGRLKGNECVIKTIVTTGLIENIAKHYRVKIYNTLTGFKFIAALIKALEGKEQFLVGGEESYGYLVGDFVRDKDAVASCAMIAEMCAYAKSKGKSLFDLLIEVYQQFGFFKERLISLTKKGIKGEQEIAQMMENFRKNPPIRFAGSKVVAVADYQSGKKRYLHDGTTESMDFPKSNVLQFITEDGYTISARPSGTEPKIKFYMSANMPLNSKSDYDSTAVKLEQLLDKLEQDLNLS